MEKQSTNSKQQWGTRLLMQIETYLNMFSRIQILLYVCFFIVPVFAQKTETDLDIFESIGIERSDLQFIEVESELYAYSRTFIIELPQITPSRIKTEMPLLEEGVSITEFNKTLATVNGLRGTRFTLVLEFDHAGEWDLPEIPFFIDEIKTNDTRFYFPKIRIETDPATVSPLAFFITSKTVEVGEKVSVMLMVQNCNKVVAIKNDLNTDSLFSLIQKIQTLPYTAKNNTEIPIAIAEYSFVGLEEGTLFIPSVHVAIVSLTGNHQNIVSTPLKIEVVPSVSSSTNRKNNESSFYSVNDGFVNLEDDVKIDVVESNNQIKLVQNIAEKEIVKLHVLQIFRKIVSACAIICVFSSLILFCFRKKQKIPFLVLALICFIGVCWLSIRISRHRAVCYQTKLQTIPELDASSRGLVDNGMIVRVKRKSGNWYLVQLSDSRKGWILSKECIDVK